MMNKQATKHPLSREHSESLAETQQVSIASARAQLGVGTRRRLLRRDRPLTHVPTIYSVTAAGLAAAGLDGLRACRVSAANCQHAATCVHAAAELQRSYPDQRVSGEHELRLEERRAGTPLASATMRAGGARGALLHRPDLVIWPPEGDHARPVAIEIELTIKSPQRLEAICRAWSRTRVVAGVVYFAPDNVQRALHRAIQRAQAETHVTVLALEALPLAAAVYGSR
jgi:hypothetical protein